jgi:hypothetical protein
MDIMFEEIFLDTKKTEKSLRIRIDIEIIKEIEI